MGKTLIIAEKPSVARDLAASLGKFRKEKDRFENESHIISSAIGHLVELYMPEDIDKKLRYWRLENLPIIPSKFELKPIEKTKSRFAELKRLLNRKDVTEVVNACDAGREGELIFTNMYELANCKKPVRRLWMQSMTKQAIRKAFENLRKGEEMRSLQNAARSRSEADWLIGINGTRAITTRIYGRARGNVATVGRVQTPTLILVVNREREIRNFKPQSYWRIVGQFDIAAGEYEGIYQKRGYRKGETKAEDASPLRSAHDRVDRIWNRDLAARIIDETKSCEWAGVKEEKKRTKQIAPQLYDLTTLQREANSRFGMSARRTLQVAQDLYEKHKFITYPRTDSRALPEDYIPTCKNVLSMLHGEIENFAQTVLKNEWVRPNRRVFNNKQISDHFAVIPTGLQGKQLRSDEVKIFEMILRRFVAVFFPSAEFDVTIRLSSIGEHDFKTEGKVLVKPGWLSVYGKDATAKGNLVPLSSEDGSPPRAKVVAVELREESTKPPPRYSEASLLSAMEGAGKFVEDEELAEAMRDKGLGTPATRAHIIEQLINQKYLEREKRDLKPTAKAEGLLDFLNAVHAESLTSPSMTGDWEYKLHLIETEELSREEFMRGIAQMTSEIVERTKSFSEEAAGIRETSIISPSDRKPILETLRTFKSQDGAIVIYKTMGNRKLDEEEVRVLVNEGEVGPLEGFRSKAGKPFIASLRLNQESKVEFVFQNADRDGNANKEENVDLSKLQIVGSCPKGCSKEGAKANVYEAENAFACENSLNNNGVCNFRISRKILGQSLPSNQVKKLLLEGKTDLIENFRSKRTKKYFSAYLVLKKRGEIGFEFPPRPSKGSKK